jgi:hypothetical protein
MQQAQERKPEAESDSGATDEAKAQAKVIIEDAEKKLVKAKADADKIVKVNRPGTGGDCDLTRRMQIWVHQGSSMPRRVSALFGCIGTV